VPIRTFHYSFNGGEVSPRFEGRADHQRYFSSLRECLNFKTSAVGGVDRRDGTRFIAAVKDHARKVRLMPFEFSVEQAYVLEMGHHYIRFLRNGVPIESSPGVRVEVATPYDETHLFALQREQKHDIMWITHPLYPQAKLLRFSDTLWSYQVITFDPPPSVEAPIPGNVALTLSATSGNNVVVNAASAVFLDGDVGRELSFILGMGSQARATITRLNFTAPTNNITVDILSPFPSLSIVAGTWQLSGPLGVGLRIRAVPTVSHGTGLKGSLVKALLVQRDIVAADLISNGSFASGMAGWIDHSETVLAAGAHTGGTGTSLQDTTKHFPALGVRVGMRVINTSSGASATIASITPDGKSLSTGTPGINFNTGNGYNVIGTGGVQIANGGAQLSGGSAGTGWIEQAIATVSGQAYQVLFNTYEGPVSAQIGAGSRGSDLFAEASFPLGTDREASFTAVSGISWVQFRNNQPTMSRVSGVRAKNISAAGWRSQDLNNFIKVRNGILEVIGLDNPHSANAIVRTQTDEPVDADVIAGAWTLEVPAWSASRGYPRAVARNQQRVVYAGTFAQPATAWHSETGAYESFGASSLADSSLEQEFDIDNAILWMRAFRDLLVGTAASEHILRGVNGPLTPANGEQLPQTGVGSHGLPPIRADNALLILQRGGRQIREVEYDENGAVVRGKDHTLLADHITEGGIVQWYFQSKPQAAIWAIRGDGRRIGLTYEQFEQVQGWHRHATDGLFESGCVVPVNAPTSAQTEDEYVVVARTINGETRRYIEVFHPAVTLDCTTFYFGVPTTTITGLGYLQGKTVSVIDRSNGNDQPAVLLDRVVSEAGTITLEVPVTVAEIGLNYPATLKLLRPEIPMRDGTLQGRKKRWITIAARVLRTGGLLINGKEAIFRTASDPMDEGLQLREGDAEVTSLGWTKEGYITLEQTQPLPCTIIAVMGRLDVEED
jgi:hypothetical protein